MENPLWYWWSNVEITATGTMVYQRYSCTEPRERQELGWTLAADGSSLLIHAIPPADVFTFGNGNQVSEVIVEPGTTCNDIMIRYYHAEAMEWG